MEGLHIAFVFLQILGHNAKREENEDTHYN